MSERECVFVNSQCECVKREREKVCMRVCCVCVFVRVFVRERERDVKENITEL